MSETCVKLVAQMLLNTMAGKKRRTWDLYEQYIREQHLYVSVYEILEAKERTA